MDKSQFQTAANAFSENNDYFKIQTGTQLLTEDEFVTGLREHDKTLADLAQKWVDARRAMATYIGSKK